MQVRVSASEKSQMERVAEQHDLSMSEMTRALYVMASENDGLVRKYTGQANGR